MASLKDELLDGLAIVTGFLAIVPIVTVAYFVAVANASAALFFFAFLMIAAITAAIVTNWPTRRRRWFFAAGLVLGMIPIAAVVLPFILGDWKN